MSRSGTSSPASGVGGDALDALIRAHGSGPIAASRRRDELARFQELPIRQALKAGRTWKRDLSKLDLDALDAAGLLEERAVSIDLPARAAALGVVAIRSREDAVAAFGAAFERLHEAREEKFAALALALQNAGVYLHVPAGVRLDEPITIVYEATRGGLFPYTLIELGERASVTVVERLGGEPQAFVCGLTQLLLGAAAELRFAALQRLPVDATSVMAREATLGTDSTLSLALAEEGAGYAVVRGRVRAAGRGSRAESTIFFFADGERHIDIATEVVHAAAATTSHTLVRSAGTGHGQGRYVGTIRILPDAHGADASLRDDALLLSAHAHVDSVPALEIAANDVKAFHGATVGSISEEELFYAQSRGIERGDAERMIALGFFEPALARLPSEALRVESRDLLESQLGRKADAR